VSNALTALIAGVAEIDQLLTVHPGLRGPLAAARAVGRSAVVLLSGHFERYFRAVNEEAAAFLNQRGVTRSALPQGLRLLHSRYPIDDLALVQWDNRTAKLEKFIQTERWLWADDVQGETQHERLLQWMRSPDTDNLTRYYRYWGIDNVFGVITRTPQSQGRLRLAVAELVDKRNNIAHGDIAAQASRSDVRRYKQTVLNFCGRADRVLARRLSQLTAAPPPW
jgi:hypothetical protein